jgi:opacity protein-like surface antigen
MVRKSGVGFLLGLVFVLSTCSVAFSNPLNLNFKKENVYLSLNAGAVFLNDISFSDSASGWGVTVNAAGEQTYDTGASISGTVGYILNNFVRTEFEFGHTQMDHDKAKGSITYTVGGAGTAYTGEVNVVGEIDAYYGLASVLVTPFGPRTISDLPFLDLLPFDKFTPFIGGGIGFVDWEDKVTSIGTQEVNGKESDTDFQAAMSAGLDFDLNQNYIARIKYSHAWVDSGKKGADDAEADSIQGSLSYSF